MLSGFDTGENSDCGLLGMTLVAVWQQQVHAKYCYHLQNYMLLNPKVHNLKEGME